MNACAVRETIDRHFEGTVSPTSERAMREHLPTCASCHAYYERWLVLSRLDPEVLPAETRIRRGLGLERRRSVVVPFGLAAVATVVAAAATLLLRVHPASDADGFAARGGPTGSAASRVLVYDVAPGKAATLASGTVGRGDELAFAYENPAAKTRLVIFGVDEHRHVYWFYPAWTNPGDDPVAIPIAQDALRHELPDAVRHDFDGARLAIRSVFLDTPVGVHEVEAMLRRDPDGPLPIPGAVESPATFVVAP
jgi:hypothetical protein